MGNFRNRQGRGEYRSAFNRKRSSFTNPSLESKSDPKPWLSLRAQQLIEDKLLGIEELPPGSKPKVGWLVNMVSAIIEEPSSKRPVQAVDLFFLSEEGSDFRTTIIARPYMYLAVAQQVLRETEIALRRKFADVIAEVSVVRLEDTSMPNHLAQDSGAPFLKVETRTTGDLYSIREQLRPIIDRNVEKRQRSVAIDNQAEDAFAAQSDPLEAILDMREYDVTPVNRLAIDKKLNVGYWYKVAPGGEESEERLQDAYEQDLLYEQEDTEGRPDRDPDLHAGRSNDLFSAHLTRLPEIVERASPVVLAYDIECTKKPLKFPDPEAGDEVMMISWMVDGQGYLVINREAVSKDIENFDYNPHAEFKGSFEVFNEPNEKALLQRFFAEVRLASPRVFVTFNGDYFDWPFVEKRALMLGLDMGEEIGMRGNNDNRMMKETKGRAAIHMDVFHWVNRDSYLPQGSRGLKAVTRVLLGFEPEEIPPEEMVAAAIERPDEMAKYSVSDAVCTYYLYMKYVHPFIFSLCNILPLNPDDVLRRGSGTLCEMLLMCQAREKRIVAPNKYQGSAIGKLTEDGHVLESETYIGGHVEAIRTGVYRSDLPLEFDIDIDAIQDLERTLDDTLRFAITVESKTKMEDVTNYDEVRAQIVKELQALKEKPHRTEKPLLYHLDVSAMYPNIILTNRLQPHAMVTPAQCAACDFNGMSDCQRDMEWVWRGEYFPASRGEAEMIQRRTAQEERDQERRAESAARQQEQKEQPYQSNNRSYRNGKRMRTQTQPSKATKSDTGIASFNDEESRKNAVFRKRLKDYCRTNYKKTQETRITTKTATVCQRENSFYVDTVRAFRDRRYEYKALLKKQKKARAEAKESGDEVAIKTAENMVVLYDSLQLAHKCILNSFYGYVMRRGARWYSMEMAGIVTNTGGLIIRRAREFIDKVGLPLELDTDGIWCALPISFPENFSFETKSGKKCSISYICSVFNSDVAANFTNHQYQDLVDPDVFEYEQRSECSILFEVDGPYKAMVLPASLEEGKSIKKRYAVFNDDGSLAELKGFEIKRRGELKLIKQFQGEIFSQFLKGQTITECYENVGATCNKWLDILTSKGEGMNDEELLELLVEQNNMSKPLAEYVEAKQKSCAITCAGRMQEFLGADIAKDKGLAAMYIVANKPEGEQVTARAIPVKIFEYGNAVVRRRLLKKWLKSADAEGIQLRRLLDWEYYKGRLANAILKIVSIPAALQAVDNPVPRIEYPPWLVKQCRELKDKRKQRTMSSFFSALPKGEKAMIGAFKSLQDAHNDTAKMSIEDIEDVPIRSWTEAKVADRRATAVVARRKRHHNVVAKRARNAGFNHEDELLLRSTAEDAESRALEARQKMLALVRQPHPDKRRNYRGWVRHAKRIWRAQRAIRVQRYAKKRRLEDFESDESDEEKLPSDESDKEPFGGKSFAEKFGEPKSVKKKRKVSFGKSLDYAPSNFVADLRTCAPPRDAFFKTKTVPLLGHGVVWQNIAVSPVLDRPGEYLLWVLPVLKEKGRYSNGQLYSIPLHVRRTVYFNSRVPAAPEIPGVESALVRGLTLPRSRRGHHLYKMMLSEERFQQTDKDIASVLGDAGAVDGVFGTQAPLEYEVIVTLGTICAPKKSIVSKMTSRKLLSQGISIEDIVPKGPEAVPYLQETRQQQESPTLYQAFLYGSHSVDDSSRAIYAVVAPVAKLVYVVAVTPSGNMQMNLKRMWKQIFRERKGTPGSLPSPGEQSEDVRMNEESQADILPMDCEFTATAARTREEAWAELQLVLSNLRNGSRLSSKSGSTGLKTLLIAQWPALDTAIASKAMFGPKKNEASLHRKLSALEECVPATRNYPVVKISSNAEDGNYMPVGWEPRAVTTALSRFVDVSNWLSSQIHLSRFAGIPIGNVSPTDVHCQALDVLVGRELINRDHVLWASSGPQPDLGGIEEDDCELQNEMVSVPEVTSPGSYRTVCVDTELTNLSIATILSSSYVNQLEGTDLAFDAAATSGTKSVNDEQVRNAAEGTVGGKAVAPLDEMASSAPAFRVLKDLVSNWDKVASHDNAPGIASIARGLLDHLNRWTRSESSLLYDPAIARFLGWLVKKVFRQLVGELKNLGATVVYASVSRIILATPKTYAIDALRYAGFLEKTIKEKPLFRHIHFQPLLGVYSGLLFVDRFNYGALPAPEETEILNGEFGKTQSQNVMSKRTYASRDIPYARMVWDMARYLPIPVAVLWTQVIEEFIRRPVLQRLRTEEQEDAEHLEAILDESESPSDSEILRDAERQRKKRMLRPRGDGFADEVKFLTKSLNRQLLEKVHEIREKTPSLSFPSVPSIYTSTEKRRRNPALEFVRSLCHVLGLDIMATEEVAGLRRNLLQLLGVGEFAKESQFVDPGLPVPLHDVICTYCNAVVDLDIARDSRLWSEPADDTEGEESPSKMTWGCEYCGNPYDTRKIELDLTRVAQKLYTSYQVQDLICRRCNMVKRENMTEYCGCSGARFEISVSHETFRKQLHALQSVAEFHKFEFLWETVSWMISSMSPTIHGASF